MCLEAARLVRLVAANVAGQERNFDIVSEHIEQEQRLAVSRKQLVEKIRLCSSTVENRTVERQHLQVSLFSRRRERATDSPRTPLNVAQVGKMPTIRPTNTKRQHIARLGAKVQRTGASSSRKVPRYGEGIHSFCGARSRKCWKNFRLAQKSFGKLNSHAKSRHCTKQRGSTLVCLQKFDAGIYLLRQTSREL